MESSVLSIKITPKANLGKFKKEKLELFSRDTLQRETIILNFDPSLINTEEESTQSTTVAVSFEYFSFGDILVFVILLVCFISIYNALIKR